jgi:hypothetical protein
LRRVNTNELVAAITGGATLIAAVATVLALRTSGRATRATEQAAAAAAASVRAAEASAQAAEALARIEIERRHDELRPRMSPTFKQEPNRIAVRSNLFALVANDGDRDYRYRATIVYDSGASTDVNSGTLLAGKIERVHVTDMALNGPETLEIVFEPNGWECSCGRAVQEHWNLRWTIPYEDLTHNEKASQPQDRKGS